MIHVIKHGFDDQKFRFFIDSISRASCLAVDTETNGLNPRTSLLLSLQIFDGNDVFVVTSRDNSFYKYIANIIQNKFLIFHNSKFDVSVIFEKTGILFTNIYCTMLAERLITSGLSYSYYSSLKDLIKKYLGIEISKEERKSFYTESVSDFTQAQIEYSATDVIYLIEIYKKQMDEIKQLGLENVLDLENKLTPVLVVSEHFGVLLDKDLWIKLSKESEELSREIANNLLNKIVDDIFSRMNFSNALDACRALNISEPLKRKRDVAYLMSIRDENLIKSLLLKFLNLNSPIQVKQILNAVYGLNVKDTNEKTLNKLTNISIISDILAYREHSKSSNAFGEAFLRYLEQDGKIHTNYNQLGAVTGRMSSDSPNLQNIKREENYRRPFIASPGYMFICADYSQEELRIMADVSREKSMIDAFNSGLDLHALTASRLFNKKIDEVTKDERSIGKSMNFAVIYGVSEHGLYRNYGINPAVGKKYLEEFLTRIYPNVGKFFNVVGNLVLERLYSSTLFGRKRFFEVPKTPQEVSSIIRKGVNMIIQGTGADIIKIAMVKMFYDNPWGIDKFRILLQVHDEIVAEADESIAEEANKFVVSKMLEAEGMFLKYVEPAVDSKVSDFWVH